MKRHGAHDGLILEALASGKYRVELDGCVLNLEFRKGNRFKAGGGCREVRQWLNPSGYPMCEITARGARACVFVHRLVAFAFLPFVGDSVQLDVNHLDGCKSNNSAWNLQWCDRAQNVSHAWQTGLKRRHESPCIWRKGDEHPMAKLSAAQVSQIRSLLDAGSLQRDIAAQFGIAQSHVSAIKRGAKWGPTENSDESEPA